jgi:hypothetical protein
VLHGSGLAFHCAIRKYGIDVFKWEYLFRGTRNTTEKLLSELEMVWISRLSTKVPNGYNLTDGGEGCIGLKHSKETRLLIGAKSKGRKKPPLTDEQRKNLSASLIGREMSAEWRANLAAAHRGKKLSAKHCAKIGAGNLGKKKPKSAEHRKKIGDTLRGRKIPEEVVAKIKAATLGKKKTPETIANMRAAQQLRRLIERIEKLQGKRR